MKRMILTLALVASPVFAADVGVSISVGQPGFYGRIDIGNYPQPVLVYPQPVVIGRVSGNRPPIYLNVPPGHANIGVSTAASTTPAVSGSILSRITGTSGNTFRATRSVILVFAMNAAMTARMRAGRNAGMIVATMGVGTAEGVTMPIATIVPIAESEARGS